MTHRERIDRVRKSMEEAGLDALVVRLPDNVLLLSGFWPMIGATTLVFPREGEVVCIAPDCFEEEVSASLWEARAVYYSYGVLSSQPALSSVRGILAKIPGSDRWRRIGYEADSELVSACWNSAESQVPCARYFKMLSEALPKCELVDASAMLASQKKLKTSYEASKIRLASEISCFGLAAFQDAVRVGVSGLELVTEVEKTIMLRGTGHQGAVRVRAYAQVATGPDEGALGYRPNEITTTRRLAEGDTALLELGVVVDGYWADRTRVRVAGKASDRQLEILDAVKRAQKASVAAMRPGARAADVDAAGRDIIRSAGFEAAFPHITGHGTGFGYHESSPILGPGSPEVLEEGMVTSVEPGIYLKPFGGFRLEDDVLVTSQGSEVLGAFPMELV